MEHVDKVSMGRRIAARRHVVGLSQLELGLAVGYTTGQAISNIERGDHFAPTEKLVILSKVLKCTPTYLLTGALTTDDVGDASNVSGGMGRLRSVPHISLESALKRPLELASEEWAPVRFDAGPKAFEIDIFDSSNEPEFREGHKVIIDPDRRPHPGDMVLVAVGQPETAHFGQFIENVPGEEDGTVRVKFLNEAWRPKDFVLNRTGRLIGVMTEHARSRR